LNNRVGEFNFIYKYLFGCVVAYASSGLFLGVKK